MAQRVGWDEEKQRIPPWHQLEWAGWVTSHTRARLFDVMRRIPWEHLIAVETDGIYTTTPPEQLGIEHSEELGGWEVSEYDEMMYVQSGTAWLHSKKKGWEEKRRGLDKESFALSDCVRYLCDLRPNEPWKAYEGQTTRFIGLGAALASKDLKARHCVWETKPRKIEAGQHGKRIHVPGECLACRKGNDAYDMTHDMVIRSLSIKKPQSYPHDIPWAKTLGEPEWRKHEETLGELIND